MATDKLASMMSWLLLVGLPLAIHPNPKKEKDSRSKKTSKRLLTAAKEKRARKRIKRVMELNHHDRIA